MTTDNNNYLENYVFRGMDEEDIVAAADLDSMRYAASLTSGSVSTRTYLATFMLEEKPGAPEEFSATVQTVVTPTFVLDEDACPATPSQSTASLVSQ